MSQTWIVRDTAPVDDMTFEATSLSFTSAGKDFYRLKCEKTTSGIRYRISLFGQYTGGGATMAMTGYYTSKDPVPAFQTWTNEGYKTMVFNDPPTGDLLTWLQKNADLTSDTDIHGLRYQDIHLEDKSLWNQFQSAWEQDDYTTALSKLQDSSVADKQLNAAVINDTTTELLRLQTQSDTDFKVNKIKIDPATKTAGEVYFTNLGSADAYEEPDSSFIQMRQYTGTTGQVYIDLNPSTKAIDTMIAPSIASSLFNRQSISLDESMQLISNAIISLRRLTVVVKDTSGNPVEGAIVKGLAGNPVTNASGIATGLLSEYALTVIPPYVDLQTKTVDVSNVTDISIDVTLEKYAENTILRYTESTSVKFSSQVKNIDVCCVGGGGGGSGGYGHNDKSSGTSQWTAHVWKGKGGGGGNIVNSTGVEVVAGTAYTLTIGSGGAGSAPLTYNADSYLEQRANTAGTGGTTSFRGVSATGGAGGSTTVGTSTNGGNGGSGNATGTEFSDGSTYYSGGGANGGDPVVSAGEVVSGPAGGTPYGGYGGYTAGAGYEKYGIAGGNGLGPGGGGGGGNGDKDDYGSVAYLNYMTNGGNGASGLVAIKLHYN